MDVDAEVTSMPTLGLVGSSGRVEKPEEKDKAPCLVAVSDFRVDKETGEVVKIVKEEDNSMEIDVTLDEVEVEKEVKPEPESTNGNEDEDSRGPRLTRTLLIFKRPSDSGGGDDYMIANPPENLDAEEESSHHHYKKKKKKKKKSKEDVLSISRSDAEKLLEMQKSISKLTSKYHSDVYDDQERRRRTLSASCIPGNDSFSGIRSPPLSAPVLLGQLPSFSGNKAKANFYRRRQLSTASSMADSKRQRFTRKKRWESEETRSSGIATPTIENTKKGHLSENNVWTPMDDYRLLVNIIQTKGNLEHVFAGTKFSCFYTFDEVAHRWETLLYDPKAGPLSQQAINNLHPFVRAKIRTEALFSEDEENLLRTVKIPSSGSGNPDLASFAKLLEENPEVFSFRTPRQLLLHWNDMKTFQLLEGQDVRDYKDPFSLYEFQDSAFLASIPDMAVLNELQNESRLVKRQIRHLEEEVESWQCMQELVVSDGSSELHSIFSISEFDDKTYAILRGKNVRYCMRSKEILLGRHSTNNKVDADLTLEGASGKVSRRQAVIQMRAFGEFYIINQGRHSIFVDSMHVPYGAMAKLNDGCLIQITHINLIFKVNEKLKKREIGLEINKELMNTRIKSLDTFVSPSYSYYKPPAIGTDSFLSPVLTRKPTSRKRTSSTSSSPGLGPSSPLIGLPRTVGPSAIGLGSITPGSTASAILPFSTGDLTIRHTSQPLSPSPFLTDSGQFTKSPASDSDVFKKPAPVTAVRTPIKVSQARISTMLPMADAGTSSAFAAVSNIKFHSNTNAVASQVQSAADSNAGSIASFTPSASMPSTSTNSLIDYSKLGLSSDITVTQRLTPSGPSSPAMQTTPSHSSSSTEKPEKSTSDPFDAFLDEPRIPSLGLVKIESISTSSSSTST